MSGPSRRTTGGTDPTFVFVHSMLLGPLTWAPVAARMTAAVVPSLVPSPAAAEPPLWPHVAAKVAEAVPPDRPVVVVAHSNAGLLVPVILRSLRQPVAGCVFVDARLPARSGTTPAATPERLEHLRAQAVDGLLPPWTTWWPEAEVARLFPDPLTRAAVSAEQPRLPLSYYEQDIPAPAGWDDRPCGYLWFGPPYDREAAVARERGWAVGHVPGGHLHQLVDPDTVAARIAAMAGPWNDDARRR